MRRTDLIYAPKINQESEIYLKPENLQVTGSFKLRGACYKISQLGDEEKAKGVIACSVETMLREWRSGPPNTVLNL